MPVQIDNDANAGAMGEHLFGAGRGVADMVYLRLSAGVGLGLILDGQPYGGVAGVAGELGHIAVVEDGLICRCGNRGCLETVASPTPSPTCSSRSRGEPITFARLLELSQRRRPRRPPRGGRRRRAVGRAGRGDRQPAQPGARDHRRRARGRRRRRCWSRSARRWNAGRSRPPRMRCASSAGRSVSTPRSSAPRRCSSRARRKPWPGG